MQGITKEGSAVKRASESWDIGVNPVAAGCARTGRVIGVLNFH